ncbi:MAG: phosphatidylserine/phosphatidylglycerophosphate/cardiolipin synthase family protein [Chloroflexi bacterium]|nr:MAG: phosphatidylserine/phosphatidylglycerophosphate/cardiolipin synthase family protein [Chloroflexota bacterium]
MPPPRILLRRLVCLALAPLVAACGPGVAASPLSAPANHRGPAASPSAGIAVGDDRLQVLPGGIASFSLIAAVISGARRSVDVEMYEFGRRDLADALIAAHARGVAVTVIDDPTVDVTALTAARLRAAGIDVLDYPVRAQMIDHVKLLEADDDVAVIGGINWGTGSAGNHDFDALVHGPVVGNLHRVFLRDLTTAGRQAAVPPPQPDRGILVASTLPADEIRPLALQLIETAQSRIDLELYVLTDTGVVHALERARARGVTIRLLLDPSQRPSDAAAAELRQAGVDVRIYRSHGEKLHAKAGIADGRRVLFGSCNWTRSGFLHNHELDIEILDSPAVANAFEASVDADWSAAA